MSTIKKRTVNNYLKPVAAVGITAALATGGALAYFTDIDTKTNSFTVSDGIDIALYEPTWSASPDENKNNIPDAAENLVPLQTVQKDPYVANESADSPCYAFLDVSVPTANVDIVDKATGKAEAMTDFELFSYEIDAQNWTLLKSYDEQGAKHHVYAYNDVVAHDGKTTNLFSEVTLANLAESSLDSIEKDQQVVVTAYGIQTTGFNSPNDAWSAFDAQRGITA